MRRKRKGSKYTKKQPYFPFLSTNWGLKKEGGSIFHKSKSGPIDQYSVTLTTYILEWLQSKMHIFNIENSNNIGQKGQSYNEKSINEEYNSFY